MPKLKHIVGNVKTKVMAQVCAVSGRPLQTGAIEYKLGNGFYIKVNPTEKLTDDRKAELISSLKPNTKSKVSVTKDKSE